MIYFLYGSDTYRSRKKLREIIEEFRKKSGSDLNFHRIDAQEDHASALKHVFDAPSLFAEKKLIVIEYAFSAPHARDAIFSSLERTKNSASTVVVLWDRELADASQKEQFAAIKTFCQKIQEFRPLKPADANRWIRDEARSRGIILSPAEISRFASLSADSWGRINALEKYAVSTISSPAAFRPPPSTLFHLGDTFFSSPRRALPILFSLFNEGHDEFKLFSYLVNHVRTLALVQSYDRAKKPVPERHGIHPYVIKKASALARALPDNHFILAHVRMFEEDVKIKTGITLVKDSLSRFLL